MRTTAERLAASSAAYAAYIAGIADRLVRLYPAEWLDSLPDTNNPAERAKLISVAMAAHQASPRTWDGAKDVFQREIRGDAALLWEVLAPYRPPSVRRSRRHRPRSSTPDASRRRAAGNRKLNSFARWPAPAPHRAPERGAAAPSRRGRSSGGLVARRHQPLTPPPSRPFGPLAASTCRSTAFACAIAPRHQLGRLRYQRRLARGGGADRRGRLKGIARSPGALHELVENCAATA